MMNPQVTAAIEQAQRQYLSAMIEQGQVKELVDADSGLTPIPWVGKHCEDCPFFTPSFIVTSTAGECTVFSRTIQGQTDTCAYFDPPNHDAAREVIAKRAEFTRPGWESWLEKHRIPIDEERVA